VGVKSLLRFVLRETIEADEDIDRNGAIPHAKVMAGARTTIERHAAKRQRNIPR
jgi:hypothetical protein